MRGAPLNGAPLHNNWKSKSYPRTSWKGNSAKLGALLLLRVCGLFFLDDLQALDHLEGEAHHAALLALVLEVDGLLVVVDEHLVEEPAVVVEALGPLGHGLVPYLARLLAHAHALLPSTPSCYPKEQRVSCKGLAALIHPSAKRPINSRRLRL